MEVSERERAPTTRTLLAVGRASGDVAHDVGNALTAIIARASLVRALSTDGEVREHADAILRAARSAAQVMARIRHLLRPLSRDAFVKVDLAAVVQGAFEMVEPRAKQAGTAFTLRLGAAPVVAGIAAELLHVVVNLAANAVDAAGSDGKVLVRTGTDSNGRARIEVLDTGPGIAPDLAERVFEPFYTTKGAEGSGLGLAISRRIVDLHGGSLALHPRQGGGTRAEVLLPAASGDVPTPRRSTSLELQAIRRSARVLVVDDDEDAREALVALLEADGFETHGAATVKEAAFALVDVDPMIVVTDLAVGDASGWDVVARARARDAMMPVVVASGDPAAADHPQARTVDALLQKPIDPSALLRTVRELAARRETLRGELETGGSGG